MLATFGAVSTAGIVEVKMPFVWEASYPESLRWSVNMPDPVAVESLLSSAAKEAPNQQAIDFYGRVLSYAELDQLARRIARGLQLQGVSQGSHVGLLLTNSPHFVAAFFGILYAGATVVPFNPTAGRDELLAQLDDSGAEVVFTGVWQPSLALVSQLAGTRGRLILCSLTDFLSDSAAAALAAERAVPALDEAGLRFADLIDNDSACTYAPQAGYCDQVAVVQYTGGTTGTPKGAMLTHANFAAARVIGRLLTGGPPEPGFKILCVLPLWHIFGLTSMMLRAIAARGEIVLHLRFDPGKVIDDIESKRVSFFAGVPAMFAALVAEPGFAKADLSSVQRWASGGSSLSPEVRACVEARAPLGLRQGYALTETCAVAVEMLQDSDRGVGLPVPGTIVEIVDLQTGNDVLPVEMIGEICLTGPQVIKGYLNRPVDNAIAFRGGRFHTGDIGYLDQDGFLFVVDRKKDMIIVGGHNVYPSAIEAVLCEMESIAEAAVIGIPDEDLGEVPKAFVVLRTGMALPSFRDMNRFLASRLSSCEIPVALEALPALPRSAAGKVLKTALRAMADESVMT